MNILQLCHKPPVPPKDGGCIAMNNITGGLIAAGHKVKVLTIHTHKHPFEPAKISEQYKTDTAVESVFVDTRINLVDAFSNLVTSDSYNISRFFSADYDIRLQEILQENPFDVVLLESLFMTPYIDTIRRNSKAGVYLRSHNLEYIIWERVAHGSRNPAKKSYIRLLARQLKKYELRIFKEVSGIVAISSNDEAKYRQLGYKGPITTVPFGVNSAQFTPVYETNVPTDLFHLGAMDWMPNQEGVQWFLDEVWPGIHQQHPELKLHLAGRQMPDELRELNLPHVEMVGEVADAYAFMQQHGVMVVPLLSAGGIRVKIIEGMALGKVIISTSVGAEGIDCTHGTNILIANTPEEFANVLNELMANPGRMEEIGRNARKLVEESFDNTVLTHKLIRFFEENLVEA